MKNILSVFLSCLLLNHGVAQYKPVDSRSSVHFNIKTFGINVNGVLKGLEGTIFFDPDHLNEAKFDVSIDANTVNTDNSLRDNHLKDNTFFDVKNYPRIHFVSTRVVTSAKKGTLLIYGKLNIKNEVRDISFPFTAEASANSYLFEGKFAINRKDFNVGKTNMISDEVQVLLSVFATKKFDL